MPVLRIHRPNEKFAREQDLYVYINKKLFGVVKPASHKSFELPVGDFSVYVKMGHCRSKEEFFKFIDVNQYLPLEVISPDNPILTSITDPIFKFLNKNTEDKFFVLRPGSSMSGASGPYNS